jgi:hypothetical protein
MGTYSDLVRRLADAGATPEMLAMVVEAFEQTVPTISAGAARMRRYRANRVESGLSVGFDGSRYTEALRERDGDGCVYCREADGTVVDHIVPISKGGTDDFDNLALACHACNCGKAGRMPGGKYTLNVESAQRAHVRYTSAHVRSLSPKKVSPTPPSKNNPLPETPIGVSGDHFEEFWRVYPKREGPNPRKPAEVSFSRAVRKGADPLTIIAGARALREQNPSPTPFVPQAVTWLNQERWKDMEPTGPPPGLGPSVEEIFAAARAKHAAAGTG